MHLVGVAHSKAPPGRASVFVRDALQHGRLLASSERIKDKQLQQARRLCFDRLRVGSKQKLS